MKGIEIVDSHAHLNLPEFGDDVADAIERAQKAGVRQIVCVGTTVETTRTAIELARQHSGVIYATAGIHPNYAGDAGPDDWDALASLAGAPEAVAVGETGLDYHRDHTTPRVQKEFFRRHLDLAAELCKPVVIHARKAESEVTNILKGFSGHLEGIRHCFSGSAEEAQRSVDLGFHVSFAGNVTWKNRERLREAAASVPAERLLVETDCPYLTPAGAPCRRNEPAHVVLTARVVARSRNVPLPELAARTTTNARELLGLE